MSDLLLTHNTGVRRNLVEYSSIASDRQHWSWMLEKRHTCQSGCGRYHLVLNVGIARLYRRRTAAVTVVHQCSGVAVWVLVGVPDKTCLCQAPFVFARLQKGTVGRQRRSPNARQKFDEWPSPVVGTCGTRHVNPGTKGQRRHIHQGSRND